MGFGIATIGYGFLLTYEAGGGVVASILLAYGFYLASRFHKRFLAAAFSALAMFPHSLFILLDVLQVLELKENTLFHSISYTIFILAWLSMSFHYLMAVKDIAVENNSKKLENKAMNRMYITAVFLLGALSILIFREVAPAPLAGMLYALQYLVIVLNFLFLHTCFIQITSEKQYEKDKQLLAEEDKKLLEKRKKWKK
ncbi:MAG TPA: hypothetical protein PLD48_02895 [Bacillota bacterium]|nr:hypothetical protein [Bacillota bacterium]HOK68436.1 hypothetical protein [Bacillota bacterium]HPP85070.1 hypothetical protein [Bacillota bacterium]